MAKKGVSLNPGYRPGSHWADCDRCSFQYRSADLQEEWNGLWVCSDCFEPRHPQDFLRVKPEKIAVGEPLNPSNTTNETSYKASDATVGVAIAGLAQVGRGGTPIPTGTFNPNTL